MTKIDRRVQKTQDAIKHAFIGLMAEKGFDYLTIQDISDRANVGRRTIYDHYLDKFDILDRLIDEHIHELRVLCRGAADLSFEEGNLIWFEYFQQNEAFFTTILSSKGAPTFRTSFLTFVIEELEADVDTATGLNEGLSREIVLRFFGAAIVEIVEAWITGGLAEPAEVVARQMGSLLDRNL
ncbi:TetR/AcrR family transcriptional regulator [Rossellomorea sp. FS2]|uniref:TetR/AcrR family transcriptional regulator n=1 Tax=Rossellomorea sp. FS2 TaxID=3391447 RepID=UPI003A4D7109